MSSDFLEDVDCDSNDSTVRLEMKASGDAFLYADGEYENFYHLPPNEIGWKNAEKIIFAINAWMKHTKNLQ